MSAQIIHLPAVGWCVRPGIRCAHYLLHIRGRTMSACGTVERLDQYVPQRLRPLQGAKPKCVMCEAALRRRAARWCPPSLPPAA